MTVHVNQMIHMKFQAYLKKEKRKKIRQLSATIPHGTLRVNREWERAQHNYDIHINA